MDLITSKVRYRLWITAELCLHDYIRLAHIAWYANSITKDRRNAYLSTTKVRQGKTWDCDRMPTWLQPVITSRPNGIAATRNRSDKSTQICPYLAHRCTYNNCSLRWRHNGHGGVSNHQPRHCLLNRLFGCRSKKTSKLRVSGPCVTGEFPAQMTGNSENVSNWLRHYVISYNINGWFRITV